MTHKIISIILPAKHLTFNFTCSTVTFFKLFIPLLQMLIFNLIVNRYSLFFSYLLYSEPEIICNRYAEVIKIKILSNKFVIL